VARLSSTTSERCVRVATSEKDRGTNRFQTTRPANKDLQPTAASAIMRRRG